METQTKMNWGAFENSNGGDEFLKMKDGESADVTFEKVEIVNVPAEDANGNQITNPDGSTKMKPQLKFLIDTLNGKKEKKVWNTGNRQIVQQVKALVEAGSFSTWLYRITKQAPSGKSKYSSYSLIQLRPKA